MCTNNAVNPQAHLERSFFVVRELREEGGEGGNGGGRSGGRIGEGLVLGIGLVLLLLGILARCPKTALLGRVDPQAMWWTHHW